MTAKIPGGYILIARKMLESEIMDKPPLYFKLWGWMLLQAKFKPKNGLERGQFKTSIKDMQTAMAHLVGYRKVTPTVKQIRGIYESLTKGSMIGTTKGTSGLIITILNYDRYQDPKSYEGHDEQVHEGKVEGTPYNKDKKDKNVIYTPNFEKFWLIYPKKVGKGAAFKSYQNIKEPKPTLKIIETAIDDQKRSKQWQDGQFIPNPATWINQRRWEDETESAPTTLTKDELFKRHGIPA